MKRLFYLPFFIMLFFTMGCLGELGGLKSKPVGKTVYSDAELMDMAQDSAANQKVTELTALGAEMDNNDLFYMIDDPSGTPVSKKIIRSNVLGPYLTDISGLTPVANNLLGWNSGGTDIENKSQLTLQFGESMEFEGATANDFETIFSVIDPVVDGTSILTFDKVDATTDPGVTNDLDEGYSPGSKWINVTDNKSWVCLDASDGAADWDQTNGAGGAETNSLEVVTTDILENEIAIGASGDDAVDFIALNALTQDIGTTGIIKGRLEIGTDITGATSHDTTELHNTLYMTSAAAVVTLDAAADAGYGSVATYWCRDAAETLGLDPQAGEKMRINGIALAVGVAVEGTGVDSIITIVAVTDTDGSGTDGYLVTSHINFASE